MTGATCESQGGLCKRNCPDGEWDFSLECGNRNRMCCFQGGSGGATDSPVTERPTAPSDPSQIPGQGTRTKKYRLAFCSWYRLFCAPRVQSWIIKHTIIANKNVNQIDYVMWFYQCTVTYYLAIAWNAFLWFTYSRASWRKWCMRDNRLTPYGGDFILIPVSVF